MATLAQLEAAAADARQKRDDAQTRLDQAKTAVRDASVEHYRAVLAKLDQPAPDVKATGKAKAAATVDPVLVAQERLDAALAELDRVRHDLGLDT